jgi:hypothetical protein
MVVLLIVVVYGATLGIFWTTFVQSITLTPIAQSYSWQIVPLANNGGSDNFEIMSWHNGHNMRGWLAFNLSSIPQRVWIMSATLNLRLWVKTSSNESELGDPTGRLYGVYALTGPWTNWGVNWSNQPSWTDQDSATAPVPSGQGGWYGPIIWMQWDLTSMVKDWYGGALPNYGMIVKDTQENASLLYSTQFFTIHQVPNQTYYPKLVITYLLPEQVYGLICVLVLETALILILVRKIILTKGLS